MHYVISDIHGCYEQFRQLLDIIEFKEDDVLYVLGDAVDRGPEPVKVLELMSLYPNIYPLMGNHEYMMLNVLPQLLEEVTEDNIESTLTFDFMNHYDTWMRNGGDTTIKGFKELSREDRSFYMDYVSEFTLYETLNVDGTSYLLIHSLPSDYDGKGSIEHSVEEILFGRPDFYRKWDQDTVIIVGHTPTDGEVVRQGNLINIDGGCVFGGKLCILCLETQEVVSVE